MVRASAWACREECNGSELEGVARIENRHAVAEHVTDIDVRAIDHDLHAVGPPALIAVGEMTNALPDALRRHRGIRRPRRTRHTWRQPKRKQTREMSATRHGRSAAGGWMMSITLPL